MSTISSKISTSKVGSGIKKIDQNRRLLALLTFVPLLVFYFFNWFLPIGYSFYISFFNRSIYSTEMTWAGLENYMSILQNPLFLEAFINGGIYTIGTTVASLVLGLLFALAVNERFMGQSLTRTAMILPYLTPTLVVAFVWTWMLAPNGIITHYLSVFGLVSGNTGLFSSSTYAMPALVVASTWKYASFAFFTILARLQAIPDSYYERLQTEGGTKLDAFKDITLPNLRGVLFLILLVRGVFLFNKFDIIWIATRGGPLDATTTLPVMIYNIMFSQFSLGKATALAGILAGILAVVAMIYFVTLNPEQEVTGA